MKRVLLLAIVGLLLIGLAMKHRHDRAANAAATTLAAAAQKTAVAQTQAAKAVGVSSNSAATAANPLVNASVAALAKTPIKPVEKQSLVKMTRLLSEFVRPNRSLDDLVGQLKAMGLDPHLNRDENEYTGAMTVVRTQNPLPGTRYFHAQYFSDENTKPFVQHMSFEFRPGQASFDEAVQAVQQAFGVSGRSPAKREGFQEWKLKDGYTVWISKMTKDELGENPNNVYDSEADQGTIRIAVEQDPHDGE